MKNKWLVGLLASLIILVFACSQQPEQTIAKIPLPAENENAAEKVVSAPKAPVLKIVSPSNGDLIKASSINVNVHADNFNLAPVGSPVKEGEGHFHVWLDSEKQLGPQTTFAFDNVVSGKHIIMAELVKSDHSSLVPKITQTINVNVESGIVPKAEAQTQQTANEFTVEADDKGFYPSAINAKNGDVKINFKFRDGSIYFAGLDVKGPFETLHYKLNGQQPLTATFVLNGNAKIDSYWSSSGVHKATLIVKGS